MRADVHAATLDLLSEIRTEDLRLPMIAERAGVHPATLYRRWGTVPALIEDIVTERLSERSTIPDTGSLRKDLEEYARGVAADLAEPLGAALVRAAALGGDGAAKAGGERPVRYDRRIVELQTMLDRAVDRRESPPTMTELVEVLLMPLWGQVLFQRTAPTEEHALSLVDRLLVLADGREARPPSGT